MATWTRETIGLEISSTSLTVDNIKIDGTTIGHTDDTDLLTLTNGALTVAGTITSTGTITGTLATAAQGNITSLGTLTTLTVDNIVINGTTIGHTGDTDLMTLSGGGIGTVLITGHLTVIGAATIAGLKLAGNIIYASDGGASITLDTSDNVTITGDLAVTGGDITSSSGAISFGDENLSTTGNLDIDGTTNLDAVDIDGAVQLDGTFTVGVDDTGYDVKFFADEPNSYMLWDQSENRLKLINNTITSALWIENTEDGATNSPGITLYRNSDSPADDDTMGLITFKGNNSDGSGGVTDTEKIYGRIQTKLISATNNEEAGELNLGVMADDVLQQNALKITGRSDAQVADLTLGNSTASKVTVKGYFAANNATPAAAPNYTVSNLSTDRALDCDSTSDAEVADVLGQVITDLIAIGIFQ